MFPALVIGMLGGVLGVAIGLVVARHRAHGPAEGDRENRLIDPDHLTELYGRSAPAATDANAAELGEVAHRAAGFALTQLQARGTVVALLDQHPAPTLTVRGAAGSLMASVGLAIDATDASLLPESLTQDGPVRTTHPDGVMILPAVTVPVAIAIRIGDADDTIGVLGVAVGSDEPPSPRFDEALRGVCTLCAGVLSHARLIERLQQAREQWETVFDTMTDGIAVVDPTLRIRRANRALAAILARPVSGLVGIDLREMFPDAGDSLDRLFRHDAGGDAETVPAGEGQTFQIAAVPMRGRPTHEGWAVAIIKDVTEQRAVEAQLLQNERMAAVGHLLSGVAHELNNPLTSIAGLSEFLLARTGLAKRDAEHLEVIQEQAERASRIVQDLLTFGRPGPIKFDDFDLNEMVERAVSLMLYEFRSAQAQLVSEFAPNLPQVRGDRHRLQQVVLNLLNNAMHAVSLNPAGRERLVRVTTAREGSTIVLRVVDSGPGIPRDALPNIFTPFFTTKEPGEGTGLGLSISYRIVQSHKGSLSVEQTGPDGTTFALSLPIRPSRTGHRRPGAAAPPATREETGASPRRVLLVDDDPAIRRMVSVLFSDAGQVVEAAPSAAAGLEMLRTAHYDLIIGDARAAATAGSTFADLLFERHPEAREKTILLTADIRAETNRWLENFQCAYFRKPFNIRELQIAASTILHPDREHGQR